MAVRLWPVLPKDNERNGLGLVEKQLIDDPEDTHVIIAVINQRRVTTDADSGETTPAARVLHVEPLVDEDMAAAGRKLLGEAHTNRTGVEQLPFETDPDPDYGDEE